HGRRAVDRRRGRGHARHAGRAARQARQPQALPRAVEGPHRAHEQGDRGAKLLSDAWGGATYERIAQAFAPIHERIVAELAPKPGERFLDLACGTGGVAFAAARTGAEVTGLDLSPD